MLNRYLGIATFACFLLGVSLNTAVPADSLPDNDIALEGGEKCIDTRRVRRTEVIDDRNILFYMKNGEIYRNQLPRRCSSLRQEKRFMYRTSLSRLCDIDMITVLYSGGSSMNKGATCSLGKFYPVSEDEAKALRGEPELETQPIPPAEPEDID